MLDLTPTDPSSSSALPKQNGTCWFSYSYYPTKSQTAQCLRSQKHLQWPQRQHVGPWSIWPSLSPVISEMLFLAFFPTLIGIFVILTMSPFRGITNLLSAHLGWMVGMLSLAAWRKEWTWSRKWRLWVPGLGGLLRRSPSQTAENSSKPPPTSLLAARGGSKLTCCNLVWRMVTAVLCMRAWAAHHSCISSSGTTNKATNVLFILLLHFNVN